MMLALLAASARAELPMTNMPTTWAADQAAAAEWFGLMPYTWGWIFAALALVGAVAFELRGWPSARTADEAPDIDEGTWRTWRFNLLLVLLAFALPGVTGDFNVFDDYRYIRDNDMVHAIDAETWAWIRGNPGGNNMELMFLSFQLDWALFQRNYAGWYLTNLLLFFAPIVWFSEQLGRWMLRSRLGGLVTMGLVGITPIFAELNSWMSARCHLMGLAFAMGCIAAWIRWREDQRWLWYGLALAAFTATQFSKPIFLFVPLWLGMLDLWAGRRGLGQLVVDKLPFLLVFAYSLNRILAASSEIGRVRTVYLGGSPAMTVATDMNLLVEYIIALLVPKPTGLRPPYNQARSWLEVEGVPHVLSFGFAPLASLVILLSLLWVGVVLWRRWRLGAVLFAAVGAVLSLGTVMNFPPHGTIFAYRYAAAGQVLTAVALASLVLYGLRRFGEGTAGRKAFVGAVALYALFSAGSMAHNLAGWHSSADYWVRNSVFYPKDGWSLYYAGKALQHRKRFEESAAHLERSKAAMPQHNMVYKRLGDVYWSMGDLRRAGDNYTEYFAREPWKLKGKYVDRMGQIRAGGGGAAP